MSTDDLTELEILYHRDNVQFIPVWGKLAYEFFSNEPIEIILKKYKAPISHGWQTEILNESPTEIITNLPDCNIGMVCGARTGLAVLDFDDSKGWEFFVKQFGKTMLQTLETTVSYQSNKSKYRRQYLFKIQQEFFHLLHYKSVLGLEFRFEGRQSVMPPSIHPETLQPYIFRNPPSQYEIQYLPEEILIWWIESTNDLDPKPITPYTGTNDIQVYFDALNQIKERYPVLEYEMWWKVISATCTAVGETEALNKLKTLWPPKQHLEYEKKMKSVINKKISPGYLINLAKGKK